jgi:hypothetical protein
MITDPEVGLALLCLAALVLVIMWRLLLLLFVATLALIFLVGVIELVARLRSVS